MKVNRIYLTSILVLLAFTLVNGAVLGTSWWVFHSNHFPNLALQQISQLAPAFQFSPAKGTLKQGLRIDEIHWQTPGTQAQLDSLTLQVDPGCLLRWRVCVNYLKAEHLTLQLPDRDASNAKDSPIEGPHLLTPIPVRLESVDLAALTLIRGEDRQVIEDLHARLRMSAHLLKIRTLQAHYKNYSARVVGEVGLFWPYRPALTVQAAMDTGYQASASVAGSLERLRVELLDNNYHPITLQGDIRLLAPDLPWTLNASSTEPYTWTLNDDERLTFLQAGAALYGTTRQIDGQISGQLASRHWPDSLSVKSEVHWQEQRLHFPHLSVTHHDGQLHGDLELVFKQAIAFNLNAEITHFKTTLANPAWDGELTSRLTVNGRYSDTLDALAINIESLRASVDKLTFQARAKADYTPQQGWRLADADIWQANNRIKARSLPPKHSLPRLEVNLTLPDVSTLYADVTGAIEGNMTLLINGWQSGARGNLQANNIEWNALRVSEASLQLAQSDRHAIQAKLQLTDAAFQDQQLHAINLAVQGNLQRWDSTLRVEEPRYGNLQVRCTGSLTPAEAIQADCDQLRVSVIDTLRLPDWTLHDAFQLAYRFNNAQTTLSPVCLTALPEETARLCLDRSATFTPDAMDLQLSVAEIPWQWLVQHSQTNLSAQGHFGAHLDVQLRDGALHSLQGEFIGEDGQLDWQRDAFSLRIPLTRLQASLEGQDGNASLEAALKLGQFGHVRTHLAIDPTRKLTGDLHLTQFNVLSLLPLFPALNELQGEAQAFLRIGGTVAEPEVAGNLTLRNGLVTSIELPWPLRDINGALTFQKQSAVLEMRAAAERAPVTLTGSLDWQEEHWKAQANFKGQRLRYLPFTRSEIYLNPDINITLQNQQLRATGRVDIPTAYIQMKAIPKGSVNTSPDVVFIDEPDDDSQQLAVFADIAIALGDQVNFRGFGLESEIAGNLRLRYNEQESLRGTGVLHLKEGRYRAYGQNLQIRSSDLIFIGPLDNPTIRVEAIRPDITDNVVVGIRATGSASNPDVELFSIPGMADTEKLHYLLTGRAIDKEAGDSNAILSSLALSISTATGEEPVANLVEKIGIKHFQLTAADSDAGTEIQLSGYLNPRLFVRYGVSVFENANTLTMRYQLRPRLFLEAISGTANALDLIWSFDRN